MRDAADDAGFWNAAGTGLGQAAAAARNGFIILEWWLTSGRGGDGGGGGDDGSGGRAGGGGGFNDACYVAGSGGGGGGRFLDDVAFGQSGIFLFLVKRQFDGIAGKSFLFLKPVIV